MSSTTPSLFALMEHRAVGIFHHCLRHASYTAQSYAHALEGSTSETNFYGRAGEFLFEEAHSARLPDAFVQRLSEAFNQLIATQILQQLVATPRAEFTNFGTFTRNTTASRITVSFESDMVLDQRSRFQVGNWPDPVHLIADRFCIDEIAALDFGRAHLHDSPPDTKSHADVLQAKSSAFLERTLGTILKRFVSERQIVETEIKCAKQARKAERGIGFIFKILVPKKRLPVLGPQQRGGRKDICNWFTLLAIPSALAAYYCWVAAFASQLRNTSSVIIPEIGRFQLAEIGASGHRVAFESDPALLRMLMANIPSPSTSAPKLPDAGGGNMLSGKMKKPVKSEAA